ncbi:MAG: hypothetical protein ACLGHN_07705 [Bacteriovoracia bacterium]
MIRNIALFLFMLVPSITNAQLNSEFTFNGQNAEVLNAEKKITIVTAETVQVPSTCTRQVPVGEREVCRNETRYRQECSWIPSSQRCWDDRDRVCRPVTRTRQECSTSPSRQVCTDRPSRRVCTERPTRRVCTTRPDGRQHCTTVGGGTHCTEVGGGRDCRTVPGERHCRTVTYTDQDCDWVTRRRCETVPGRNECHSVPYPERVCRMETQYETETYACTRTETVNRTAHKDLKAETNVQIITNGLVEEFPVAVSIKESNSQFSAFTIEAKLMKEPSVFVVLKKKEVKIASNTEKEIVLKGELVLEVLSQEMLPVSFPTEILKATVDEKTKKMVIVLEGPVSALGEVDFKITHDTFFTRKKTIAEMKASYPSEKVELGQVENKAALSIDLTEALKRDLESKNMLLTLKLSSELNLRGTLMNEKKPENSKLYEGTFVELE